MIRFSPIFSGGVPGAALLLMRIATAATLLLAAHHALRPDAWQLFIAAALAIGLLMGLFTRVLGALGALLLGVFAIRTGGPVGGLLALHGIQALALALLGAGAYSIDARLFGRRVIRLDDGSDPFG
jgi:hypothetical protein